MDYRVALRCTLHCNTINSFTHRVTETKGFSIVCVQPSTDIPLAVTVFIFTFHMQRGIPGFARYAWRVYSVFHREIDIHWATRTDRCIRLISKYTHRWCPWSADWGVRSTARLLIVLFIKRNWERDKHCALKPTATRPYSRYKSYQNAGKNTCIMMMAFCYHLHC